MNRKDILLFICGPQRSGTTFLITLFTHLGYNTGFSQAKVGMIQTENWHHGGLEHFAKPRTLPEVIKQSWAPNDIYSPTFYLRKFNIYPKYIIITERDAEQIFRSQVRMLIKRDCPDLISEEDHREKIRLQYSEQNPISGMLGVGNAVAGFVTYENYILFSITRIGQEHLSMGYAGIVSVRSLDLPELQGMLANNLESMKGLKMIDKSLIKI